MKMFCARRGIPEGHYSGGVFALLTFDRRKARGRGWMAEAAAPLKPSDTVNANIMKILCKDRGRLSTRNTRCTAAPQIQFFLEEN